MRVALARRDEVHRYSGGCRGDERMCDKYLLRQLESLLRFRKVSETPEQEVFFSYTGKLVRLLRAPRLTPRLPNGRNN